MIALIVGPESRSARLAAQEILLKADPNGLNTSRIDGRSCSQEEAIAAVSAPGFFGSSRVVMIEDAMAKSAKGGDGDDVDAPPAKGGLDFKALFAAVAPGNVLVLLDRSIGTVPAAVRKVAPKDAVLTVCEAPRGQDLVRWMTTHAKQNGSSISDQVARQLATTLFPKDWATKPNNPQYDRPPDLEMLANEIDKLIAVAHPAPIEATHVTSMTAVVQEDRLFPLIDALLSGDLAKAAAALASLRERGDEPGRITAQLFQQAELLAVLGAGGRGRDPLEIGKDLGLPNPARMSSIARSSQSLRRSTRDWVETALAADRGLKSGQLRQAWDPLYQILDDAGRER